jgi:hypothetical protein
MSTSPAEYERLLREAINQAKASAPRAVEDLLRCSSQAAEAVAGVTGGAAALELVPINQGEDATPTYQLQLRRVGSEAPPSDLGIYRVTAAGYPVLRWYSRKSWESRPDQPDGEYPGVSELESNFRWLVSNPSSRLVVLVTFFQDLARSSTGTPAGSA